MNHINNKQKADNKGKDKAKRLRMDERKTQRRQKQGAFQQNCREENMFLVPIPQQKQ